MKNDDFLSSQFLLKKLQEKAKNLGLPPPRGMLRSSWDNPVIVQRRQLVYLGPGKNENFRPAPLKVCCGHRGTIPSSSRDAN